MANSLRLFAVLALALVANASANRTRYASVAEAVSKTSSLSTLLKLVGDAGLADDLGPDFEGTVFAPTNAAFDDLPADTLKAVTSDVDLLTEVLTYHVTTLRPSNWQFWHRDSIRTLAGTDVRLGSRGWWWGSWGLTVEGNGNKTPSNVVRTIRAGKAWILVIDQVLLP